MNKHTTVILDTASLTKNLTIERICHLEDGCEIVDNVIPDGCCVYIRVTGEGHGHVYPEILDGDSGPVTLTAGNLVKFKLDAEKWKMAE